MDRIVVGVDGTPESVAAARSAGGLAGKMGFNVTLAFVVSSATALGPEEMLGQRLEWEREEEERGRRMLREVTAACELPEGRVESLVLHGDPAAGLAEVARTSIMLVVGHRHRGAVSRALLGSVADRLAQISPVPLLVVPETAQRSQISIPS
jgi:nucleotide-binding universal stress UspA family protein